MPVLVAALPCTAIYAFVVWKLPAAERRRGLALLLLGVFSLLPVVFLVVNLQSGAKGHFTNYFAWSLFETLALAAIPEELARYLVLRWTIPRLSPPGSCLLLGCLAGLGLGGIEYLLFVYTGGWEACWQRFLTSLPFHTAAGGIIGYFVGAFLHGRYRWSGWGLAITIPLHAFNNFNLRNFEQIDDSLEEPKHSLLQQILFSHWPSNLLVTCSACIIAIILYRRSQRSTTSNAGVV